MTRMGAVTDEDVKAWEQLQQQAGRLPIENSPKSESSKTTSRQRVFRPTAAIVLSDTKTARFVAPKNAQLRNLFLSHEFLRVALFLYGELRRAQEAKTEGTPYTMALPPDDAMQALYSKAEELVASTVLVDGLPLTAEGLAQLDVDDSLDILDAFTDAVDVGALISRGLSLAGKVGKGLATGMALTGWTL